MAYQTGRNVQVNYKVEGTFNTAPGATGATGFRPTPGAGLNLNKRAFQSNEVRRDGLSIQGRHGSRGVEGSYSSEVSLGTHDAWFEAIARDTWVASLAKSAPGDFASLTTGANTIILSGGNPITLGFRVGDIIRLTNHSDAANNNKNLRITALSATTITVAETLVVNASADSAVTITRGKKLTRLAGTSYTDRTFSVEEYNIDLDASELYTGVAVSTMRLQVQPNGMVLVTFGLVGADGQALASGSSPYFTNPTLTTSLPMVAADAKLRVNGTDVADLTAFDMTMNIGAQGVDVVGSYVTPAIFTNQLAITGSISALRKDLANLTAFSAETQFDVSLLLIENEAEPKDYISLYLPSVKFADANKNEIGANGARIETLPIMVGYDPGRTSEYDASMFTLITSAA